MSFMIRPLKPGSSLGTELVTIRRRLAIPLAQVAQETKIQKRYVKAMEEDRWHDLPEPLYTRNFLRSYVQFLGEDPTYFLSRFEQERGCCDFLGSSQTPRQKVRRGRLLVTPRLFKLGFLTLLLFGIFGYLGGQVRSIVEPPTLTVLTPTDGSTTDSALISVAGEIKEEAHININGNTVLPDREGFFSTTITLERGLNVVTIEGKKRYSRPAVIYRTIVFDPPTSERTILSLEE